MRHLNWISHIKSHVDILVVVGSAAELKKKGHLWIAKCPLHSEKSGSFYCNPTKQTFHCFGCGRHGDVIGFIRQLNQCGFMEACKYLVDTYNIPCPRAIQRRMIRESIRLLEQAGDIESAKALAAQL